MMATLAQQNWGSWVSHDWFLPLVGTEESGTQQFCGATKPACAASEGAGLPYWTQGNDFGLMQINFAVWNNQATIDSLFDWTQNLYNAVVSILGPACGTNNKDCPIYGEATIWPQSTKQYNAYLAT